MSGGLEMASEQTTQRIFEKLDELKDELHEVSNRLTKVEENQKNHYKDNDRQHNEMTSNIVELKDRINEVESVLDKRAGERKVFGNGWQLILTLLSGAALLALGGLASKILGVFGH